ncbi:4-hydroxy-tetrahydrodipicolinate synthase [Ornithinimicrobium pekingense]|uniref:4-hydroxy-tetrahydrodipicolinate synthase n=1 Tax=Ornithinimicrobium pekingense TaxID=384677 RepID=A0ABQ2FBJ0_9MICO|nr:4-hydroxy-tetrahydrodipicolinate synthase [Ornithinimicrobium pekingense]GGK71485.1 4-hydroxy-tetrahydrodipicolinate synthase [Ornithinimicrobium pekingense]
MSTSPTATPFTGLGVALATPFVSGTDAVGSARKPEVDHAAFGRLLEHVLAGGRGVDHLVVLGSTGEAATVTDLERHALVRQAVEAAAASGRDVPVVVGVGHNDTERTCELAAQAAAAGADGLLVVTPYYNKPQVSGLVAHYRAVAAAAPGLPIMAYNVPGRTGLNLTPAAVAALWQVEQVVALKESSGDIRQIARLCQEAPAGRAVLAGDDDVALAAIAVGAQGLVSVVANVAPVETAQLVHAATAGDLATARETFALLAPLMAAMFVETNPVPAKAALACLGIATAHVRLPLSPAEPATWTAVQRALAGLQAHRRTVRISERLVGLAS